MNTGKTDILRVKVAYTIVIMFTYTATLVLLNVLLSVGWMFREI